MNLLKTPMNERQEQIYEFEGFRVDVAKRLLTRGNGEPIQLTPKVFDTLLYLVRHGSKVLEKDELMREIWADSVVEENNLNQNISILRRAFGEKPGEQRFIVTVAGHGYRFVPEVRAISNLEPESRFGKTEDAVFRDEAQKTQGENAVDQVQHTSDPHPIPNRKPTFRNPSWLAAFIVLGVSALGAAGFYGWRGNETSVDAPIKTLAVLPFKPLVVESRNETLELGMADTLISKLSGDEIVVRPLSAIRRYHSVDQDA